MHNVIIISTNHTESGKCNSEELYKIIESLNPEVIFEEMPVSLFDIVYNGNLLVLPSFAPLELKCVKKYIENHSIKHFPVDIDTKPSLSKDEIFMFDTFAKNEDYNKLENEYKFLKAQEGLDFLNSDRHLEFSERKSSLEKEILESAVHNSELLRIYEIFNKEIDNRENAMLENIYNFSKENQYNRAVFLLGAGHRRSIMKKTLQSERRSEIKLNWTMFGNK